MGGKVGWKVEFVGTVGVENKTFISISVESWTCKLATFIMDRNLFVSDFVSIEGWYNYTTIVHPGRVEFETHA